MNSLTKVKGRKLTRTNKDSHIDAAKLIVIPIGTGCLIGISVALLSNLYDLLWLSTLTLLNLSRYFILITAPVGLTVAYLMVQFIARIKTTGCGTHQVIETYLYHTGAISGKDTVSKAVASAVTIGSGGSAGLEGPGLLLGGGVASAIGWRLGLRPHEVRVLFVSGAAAGLSAIFRAPLTGTFFALEIPYRQDLVREFLVPALSASLASYVAFVFLKGGEILFPIAPVPLIPTMSDIAYSALIGLICAEVAVLFTKLFRGLSALRQRANANPLMLSSLIGLVVGAMGLTHIQVLGIGYETIHSAAVGELYQASTLMLFSLLVLKIIATCLTLNFGGSGGLFIPTIYVGAVLGVILTKAVVLGPNEVFVMASMAAMVAAANKTLFTSIAFVAETCGPSSIVPTMIAASISYFVSGKASFYDQLPKRPVEEKEALIEMYHLVKTEDLERVRQVKIGEVMTRDPVAVGQEMTVSEALRKMRRHGFRVYPVIGRGGSLVGQIKIEDILALLPERRAIPIYLASMRKPVIATAEDSLFDAVEELIEKDEDRVYVIDNLQSRKLIGVVAGIDAIRKLLEVARY